jgi:hypothetical protein
LLFGGLSIRLYGQREIAYNQSNEYEISKLFWELIIIKIITISLILCVYARHIAESFSVQCIGTLAILVKAKQLGLIPELRSLFMRLLAANRFYKKSFIE